MEIVLSNTDSDSNVINKRHSEMMVVDVQLPRQFNILNPVLRLGELEDYNNYNYCEIPELGRCYFIDTIDMLAGGLVEMQLSCDVLETYADDILNSYARYRRGSKEGDYAQVVVDRKTVPDITIYEGESLFLDESVMVMCTIGV